jgi:hypothetical protein
MRNAIKASFAYWAIIFGLGFVLGTVRTLWFEPYPGSAVCAVAIELPFMLAGLFEGAGLLGLCGQIAFALFPPMQAHKL